MKMDLSSKTMVTILNCLKNEKEKVKNILTYEIPCGKISMDKKTYYEQKFIKIQEALEEIRMSDKNKVTIDCYEIVQYIVKYRKDNADIEISFGAEDAALEYIGQLAERNAAFLSMTKVERAVIDFGE